MDLEHRVRHAALLAYSMACHALSKNRVQKDVLTDGKLLFHRSYSQLLYGTAAPINSRSLFNEQLLLIFILQQTLEQNIGVHAWNNVSDVIHRHKETR